MATKRGSRASGQRGKQALVGIAIEVRGRGSGRLGVLPDASGPALARFTQATTEPGAVLHTDGLQPYRGLSKLAPVAHGTSWAA